MKKHYYGSFANLLFEPLTDIFIKLLPKTYKKIQKNITYAGLPILTKTYLNTMNLTLFLVLTFGSFISIISLYMFSLWYPLIITLSLLIITKTLFLLYPKIKANQRKKTLDKELPFTISLLATLSSLGLKNEQLFHPLLKLKQTRIEALRIINSVKFKKIPIEQTLIETSNLTPSTKLRNFLKQLATQQNKTAYLKQLATQLTQEYKTTRKLRKNLFKETGNIFHNLSFKFKHFLFIFLAVLITIPNFYFFFDFATYNAPFFFYIILLLAIIIAWLPFFLDINKKFKTDREKENQFLKFTSHLNRGLTNLQPNTYGILEKNIEKLINQHKMGIPLKTSLKTFAKQVNNTTIKEIIHISLETNNPQALTEVTKALILKNKLKFSSSKKESKK